MKMVNLRRPPAGVNLQGASFIGGMADVNDHVARVAAGGGTGANESDLFKIYRFLHSQGLLSGTRLLWTPEAGYVQRVDGVLKYCRTGFDTSLFENDLDGSATASQQPRLVGGIAPNSKPAASNQNGEARYFTHPAISFAATDAWSVSIMFNWHYTTLDYAQICGDTTGWIGLKDLTSRAISFRNSLGTRVSFTSNSSLATIGKKSILTLVANGSGSVSAYLNGNLINSVSIISSITFNRLIGVQNDRIHFGTISAYHIQSGAMSAAQVLAEYNLLRAMYPEIESVVIGSQTCATRNFEAVASSNGTVVPQLTTQAAWSAGTSGWCYHNGATPDTSSPNSGAIYGKLYNKAAKLVLVANPPSGWHYATKAELTALAANGGNALKYGGTDHWSTTGGTNTTGFTALGGSSRNADGTFNAIKETASWWCADSDEVLKVYHNSDVAEIVAAGANEGHSLRLIKNA